MSLTHEKAKNLFNHLKTGKNELFFEKVAPDVQWTVMGTHPLAGTYHSKEDFITHTFGRLNKILKEGVILEVRNIFIDFDVAIVEMESLSTALNGKPFNNTYCWIVRFEDDMIVEVRAYVDSALVQNVIEENEK